MQYGRSTRTLAVPLAARPPEVAGETKTPHRGNTEGVACGHAVLGLEGTTDDDPEAGKPDQPSDFASASMIRMGISERVAARTSGSNGACTRPEPPASTPGRVRHVQAGTCRTLRESLDDDRR